MERSIVKYALATQKLTFLDVTAMTTGLSSVSAKKGVLLLLRLSENNTPCWQLVDNV